MKYVKLLVSCLLVVAALTHSDRVLAQPPVGAPAPKFGIGLQFPYPSTAIIGTITIDEAYTGQLLIDAFGDLKNYSAKVLYSVRRVSSHEYYLFGSLDLWKYTSALRDDTETALGITAGIGIEYDWRNIKHDLPPIYWSIEIGARIGGFDIYRSQDPDQFWIGFGANYRFN